MNNITAATLDTYAFFWSLARLLIAALALLLGGIPPISLVAIRVFPSLLPLTGNLLHLAWIVTGAATLYLLYRWNAAGRKLPGAMQETAAFWILIVSGFNLGIAGLLNTNLGMRISSNHIIFAIVAIAYLFAAYTLWSAWKNNGKKLFS